MTNKQEPKESTGRFFAAMLQERGAADVMVLGGGVSGIQASLDLAASGFRVYLVDRSPAIGGHMAQLDKTYPTNDCSM